MTALFTLVNLAHTRKATLRQQTCSTASLPLTCKVYFNYTSFGRQKHVHIWYTAYTKSTKPLRDSGDMFQIAYLIPIFNWISKSLTNTRAKSNMSDHTVSVLSSTLELKITKILPQYEVTTCFSCFSEKVAAIYSTRKSSPLISQTPTNAHSPRSVVQSCRSSHYCYPVLGLPDPAHWSHKHGTRHCRQTTSCHCCFPKGFTSLDHASLVNWMSGISHKSKHYSGNTCRSNCLPIQLHSLLAIWS